MTDPQRQDYLENHLGNELQWLLRAATEWHIQNELQSKFGGYHMQVYAMDSTFLHARTLFEFLTEQRTLHNYYACDTYSVGPQVSPLYTPSTININSWKAALHGYSMHSQDRSNPRQIRAFDGVAMKDLNEMPVDFAKEVVRLWRDFQVALAASSDTFSQTLSPIALSILQEAIDTAGAVRLRQPISEPLLNKVTPISW